MTSVTSFSNRWLNRLYKIIAILLVLFAVLLSALRLMLPYAQNYRLELQDYLNQSYQGHIIIGGISTGWQKLGPTLVAQNVSLVRSDLVNIFIDRIDFSIDFWGSIQAGQLLTNDFTLQGAKVFIDRNRLVSDGNLGDNTLILQSLGDLFLKQVTRFSLRDSQLVLQGENGSQRTIVIDNLAWLNRDGRHQASGEVIFDGISANNARLTLDINGNDLQDIDGVVYLSARNLDVTPWLGQMLPLEHGDNKTSINFDTWITLEQGKSKRIQVELGKNVIDWQQGQPHHLEIGSGQLLAESDNNFKQFNLFSSPIALTLDDKVWQEINIQASKQSSTKQLYLSYADIASLSALLPLFSDDEALKQKLADIALRGELADIYLQKEHQQLKASVQMSNLNSRYSDGIPGVNNLSANVLLAGDRMQILAKASAGELDFGEHFPQPLAYDELSASINGRFNGQGWQLVADDLSFHSADINLSGQLTVAQRGEQPVTMALLAKAHDIDASHAGIYYPYRLMGDDLVHYLNSSLISGRIESATVLFNGALSDFPFTDHSGIFTVDAELSDAEFRFDPHWPSIHGFSANLNFTNNSMLISAHGGELSGLDVAGVTAAIDDLSHEQILQVQAELHQVDPVKVTQLMQNSPLKDSVGATLARVQIAQPISGNFSLNVPLNNAEQTLAQGLINFQDNRIHLTAPDMNFSAVNGQLHFANERISTTGIVLDWQGLPMHIDATTESKPDYFLTKLALAANWQPQQYQMFIPQQLKGYGAGPLHWQGELSLFMPHDGAFSYQLALNSDLTDTVLKLPQPYQKTAAQKLPLQVTVNGQLNQSTIDAKLGEQLKFFGVLEHQQPHFSRAHLLLGDEQMLLPMAGFHISANLNQAKFSEWQPLVLDIISSLHDLPESDQPPLLAKPQRIRGAVAKFDILGEQLNDVTFNLLDQQNWWLLQLNAKEARSQIKFYPDWLQQGIDVDADFIHIAMPETLPDRLAAVTTVSDGDDSTQGAKTDVPAPAEAEAIEVVAKAKEDSAKLRLENDKLFAELPPMKVHCASCRYGALDFGKLDFNIERSTNDVISLTHFKAERDKTELNISGQWQHNPQQSVTTLSGALKTKDVAQEIEKLGLASVIKESGADIDFSINWQDSPFDFELGKLNGKLAAHLSDGYLAEVSDKGARIFSVLSLQSLVRKLRLDFRDIFSDGMFYSQINGDFHLDNGVLYTDNTKMKGAAGDLTVKGNTKLAQGLLDYRMSYKPNLTSSLPVLAWIATLNPVTFLAGVAIDEVLTTNVVSEFNFELTGNVNEPNLREVNRKNRNISVGRSTPPQFVDVAPQPPKVEPDKEPEKQQQKPKSPGVQEKFDG